MDVVWLSPVHASPQGDNGYDISDYQAIDPTFGTLADIDELVAQLHRRGIKLLMDLVVNHTSTSTRGSRSPGAAGTTSAWEWAPAPGQYYLQLFSRKQPDLNWEHPDVRAAVFAMMR